MNPNYSRSPGTLRQFTLKLICNNPGCNSPIRKRDHLWINRGIYCCPWCERNFGKDPNEKFKRNRK